MIKRHVVQEASDSSSHIPCSESTYRDVARGGVEPPTFRFSVGRSYQLSYLAVRAGQGPPYIESDPDGTRTRDLRRDRATR